MTEPSLPADLEKHNAWQRTYFERRDRPKMRPADTYYVNRQVDELISYLGLKRGDRVLDVGCGMGRHTPVLLRRGLAVEGIDITPGLLEKLRQSGGEIASIPLHLGDVAIPPDELLGRFDAAIGFFTLHHLHDLTACFRGMASVVVPGGRIGFVEPNPYNPLYYVQMLVQPGMTWEGDKGMLKMRPSVLREAIEDAGLDPLPWIRFGFFPPVVANKTWAPRAERLMERLPPLRPVLPFQLIGARRTPVEAT